MPAASFNNLHTFVVPAYRESPYLEDCLTSLKRQSIPGSIVIATSTPSDFLEDLAKKNEAGYYINPAPNQGIAADWNFALSVVKTPWATIAHQDDLYDTEFTKHLLEEAAKRKGRQIQIVFTNYHDIVNNRIKSGSLNSIIKKLMLYPFFFSRYIESRSLKKLVLKFGDPICCPSVSFNLEVLKDFKFSAAYNCVLDWEAWYRMAGQPGGFLFIDEPLVKHRIHRESETTLQLNAGKRQKEELELFNRMWGRAGAKLIAGVYKLGYHSNKV